MDWLFHIGEFEKINIETMFLALDLYDRVIPRWKQIYSVTELKSIALACLDIAAKYLEVYFIDLEEIYYYNNKKYYEIHKDERKKYNRHDKKMVDSFIINLYEYEKQILIELDFVVYGGETVLESNNNHFVTSKKRIYKRYPATNSFI